MGKKQEQLGIQILMNHGVEQKNQSSYSVKSATEKHKTYFVEWIRTHWQCSCPYFEKDQKKCKHIYAVLYFKTTRKIKDELNTSNESVCPTCLSKKCVIKRGKSYNRSGTVQRYFCKRCKKRFQGRISFQKMKHKGEIISSAIDLYFRGLSLRQVQQHLQDCHQTKVTHTTIHNWIRKYVYVINEYLDEKTIASSDRWHADETVLRVDGRHMQLWTLLDSESRFLIATHMSTSRGTKQAKKLLNAGVEKCNAKPLSIVTDGLSSYDCAIHDCLSSPDNCILHLKGPLCQGLNNKMERYNGVLKARVKPLLHLKNKESAKVFSDGFNIFYNYIKPHSSLSGLTPSQYLGLTEKKTDLEQTYR